MKRTLKALCAAFGSAAAAIVAALIVSTVMHAKEVTMEDEVFDTQRLTLKVLGESCAQAVLDYYLRNRAFLEEWEPVRSEAFYTPEYHREQLKKDLALAKNKTGLRLWIFKKGDQSKVIGSVAFNNIVWGAFLSCHLGYKLDQNEINQGYMTEALAKGIGIMFGGYGLHRIEANILPRNKRSLRVVEKLGFYNEGLAYKYLKINGVWEDHIHMVLLNDKV